MPVRCINEKFMCTMCGNEAMIVKVGGGTIHCCGAEMEHNGISENTETRKEDTIQ